MFSMSSDLVDNFVDSCFLVTGTGHNVLIVGGDIAAENR